MEQSEQQKAILELGKLLVKELDLERSVDTLSRWMAHYVAEKIKQTEALPDGVKKRNAEKECFSLILDLWKHRWHFEPGRQPLRDFTELFGILKNLNPEKNEPFYYRWTRTQSNDDNNSFEPVDLENLSPLALQIDKVARIWINYLLHEAAAKAKNENIKKIIDRAVKLPDSMDAHIVHIIFADSIDNGNERPVDEKGLARKNRIKTLNRRISELQKFKQVNDYLIGQFEKELNDLQ